MSSVQIDGKSYRPVDEEEAREIAERLAGFRVEGTTYFRDLFIRNDTNEATGERYGMYGEGDERAPFFTEAFLYNLLGKDDARSVLGLLRQLCELAGVHYR
jgi:hypothetical protein